MNLPSLPSFRAESFPGAPEWLARLLGLINQALRPLHLAVASLPETAFIGDRTIIAESTGSAYIDLKNPLSRKPREVRLSSFRAEDNAPITTPFAFTWSMSSTGIRLLFCGLTAAAKYHFSVSVQ